jgi:hypothetical protein
VRHLPDGTLRRIQDEPLAMTAADQAHFQECGECKTRAEGISVDAGKSAELLALPHFQPQPAPALASLHKRLRAEKAHPVGWYERVLANSSPRLRRLATPAIAFVLAAVLLSGLAVTGVAAHFFKIFEPTQIQAVQVSPSASDFSNLLLDYGSVKWLPGPPSAQQTSDAASAQATSGFRVLLPASLPNGINGPLTYGVVSEATGSLTFDANALKESAAAKGVRVSPMPSSINGSTLIVKGGPALIEIWGLSSPSGGNSIPTLVVAQTRVPSVESSGADPTELENYLLSQPGVPPEIAAQVRASKDPSSTLPIPIPKGLATSKPVQINGVQGVQINAGLGAGVVWLKNGVIYAVGGQLTPDQVLAIATSLH